MLVTTFLGSSNHSSITKVQPGMKDGIIVEKSKSFILSEAPAVCGMAMPSSFRKEKQKSRARIICVRCTRGGMIEAKDGRAMTMAIRFNDAVHVADLCGKVVGASAMGVMSS